MMVSKFSINGSFNVKCTAHTHATEHKGIFVYLADNHENIIHKNALELEQDVSF
jgi:hypothetical protein